jgi:3-deoxy-D-manno-octulosonate 8-phosphate phosphatase (KDO 8-P phosphatase)
VNQTIPAKTWAAIRLFAMDVDGVLTDGTVQISAGGPEMKSFSILDGMGFVRLNKAGVTVAWISGRPSGATRARAAELKISHLIEGRTDKLAALQELAVALGLTAAECAYMGDDDIDAPAIAWAGVGAAPRDAMPAALKAARYVPARPAGRGAVRELCEHILAARTTATAPAGERNKKKGPRTNRP